MRSLKTTVSPDPDARDLGGDMLTNDEVMREILDETIPQPGSDDVEVKESGRTVCGENKNLHGPLARFPASVKLAECPIGIRGGTWHTHVTKDQLKNPNNSLPDMSNVFFGEIDVSIVAGTESAEMVVAADDREKAKAEFQDAMGLEADSTQDVIDAIVAGEIRDPTDARERVRSRLDTLFLRRSTGYDDLQNRLDQSAIAAAAPGGESIDMRDARFYAAFNVVRLQRETSKNPVRNPKATREWARKGPNVADTRVARIAADSTVSTIVSRIVRSML